MKKARKQVTTVAPVHPAFPHANGFNGFLRALPGGPGFLVPVALWIIPQSLTPASGRLLPAFRSSCAICGPTFTNFGKPRQQQLFDSSAACDFEVPERNRGELSRNFKIDGTGTTRLRRPRPSPRKPFDGLGTSPAEALAKADQRRSSRDTPRPPHPAPTSVTIAKRPSFKGAGRRRLWI